MAPYEDDAGKDQIESDRLAPGGSLAIAIGQISRLANRNSAALSAYTAGGLMA